MNYETLKKAKILDDKITSYERLARSLKKHVVQVRYLTDGLPEERYWCDTIRLDEEDKQYLLEYTENKIERIKKELEKL